MDRDYSLEDITKPNENSLTPEELEKVVQAFQAFDKNGDDYIDEQELKNVLESKDWARKSAETTIK